MSYSQQYALFDNLPREHLTFLPTPLHKLERLSDRYGVELYIKRDDLIGRINYGGNKMRKLEFLLGEAKAQGADTVITFGAIQSNHAMQTVSAARACGMEPILFLTTVVETDPEDVRANLLIDKIMDAEIHIIPKSDEPEEALMARVEWRASERQKELEREGRTVYTIPVGGSTEVGAAGFARGMVELCEQMEGLSVAPDYIVHATGSAGTLGGMIAGKAICNASAKILSVLTAEKPESYLDLVMGIAEKTWKLLGYDAQIDRDAFSIISDYFEPGYEIPNVYSDHAIKTLAKAEGILLDPIYTAKAFGGMLDMIEKGEIEADSRVVFWHTGGALALFAERELLGNLY